MKKEKKKEIKIILTGGGTAGSVMPLVAVYQELKQRKVDTDFLFIGTKKGPEKKITSFYNISFKNIPAGKLRRYLSIKNLTDPVNILKGYKQARDILKITQPDIVFSAGGYVAVPVIWAAKKYNIPVIIHQQDIRKGLANKLTEKKADKITVTFKKSLLEFPRPKTVLTGNPIRKDILSGTKKKACEIFCLKKDLPILLVLGGGTGALKINKVINKIAGQLVKNFQIIHLTGQGKKDAGINHENYKSFEFLTSNMNHALAAADLVVSRAGLCALSELSALGKPAIIIPIFNSHQEENARFYEKENAVFVIRENLLNPKLLLSSIKGLLTHKRKLNELSQNIKSFYQVKASSKVADLILAVINNNF
ncbi:MAG: undecaprenyldiphospho-muramoylpentapeptide beta-N-acetylglucosaminyltransferase [Patescibacteria group bacterium]|nr:undecaprenyldiphospho-muramoylpentapeptide beta-N-acetylglucosaminyltransferase [Patescibacteria group bacterium]